MVVEEVLPINRIALRFLFWLRYFDWFRLFLRLRCLAVLGMLAEILARDTYYSPKVTGWTISKNLRGL